MKIFMYFAVALAFVFTLNSCKKDEGGPSAEDVAKANEFKAVVGAKQFQIKTYYSDKPIDYIEDDTEVRSETDLARYISSWIKDDHNIFDLNTGKVSVHQNQVKISTDNSDIIVRDFAIGADKNGPYFNFLTHMYEPLQYRVLEFSADHFVVYVDWHSGAKVFTRFEVVN